MKHPLALTAILLLGSVLGAAQTPAQQSESKFQPGGTVKLDLSAGDWEVRAGASDKIVVQYFGDTDQVKRVRTRFQVNGAVAKLTVDDTPTHNNAGFHAVVEVPADSDLVVRLTAGDLNIGKIRGSKDIQSHAGDVNIEIADASDYGEVDLSVTAGDIDASPFGGSRSGLFRKFRRSGTGQYRLHAHIGAGDLRLFAKDVKHETL
jgi:hypothetical protein